MPIVGVAYRWLQFHILEQSVSQRRVTKFFVVTAVRANLNRLSYMSSRTTTIRAQAIKTVWLPNLYRQLYGCIAWLFDVEKFHSVNRLYSGRVGENWRRTYEYTLDVNVDWRERDLLRNQLKRKKTSIWNAKPKKIFLSWLGTLY